METTSTKKSRTGAFFSIASYVFVGLILLAILYTLLGFDEKLGGLIGKITEHDERITRLENRKCSNECPLAARATTKHYTHKAAPRPSATYTAKAPRQENLVAVPQSKPQPVVQKDLPSPPPPQVVRVAEAAPKAPALKCEAPLLKVVNDDGSISCRYVGGQEPQATTVVVKQNCGDRGFRMVQEGNTFRQVCNEPAQQAALPEGCYRDTQGRLMCPTHEEKSFFDTTAGKVVAVVATAGVGYVAYKYFKRRNSGNIVPGPGVITEPAGPGVITGPAGPGVTTN